MTPELIKLLINQGAVGLCALLAISAAIHLYRSKLADAKEWAKQLKELNGSHSKKVDDLHERHLALSREQSRETLSTFKAVHETVEKLEQLFRELMKQRNESERKP